jgi:hypothetical protein
MSQIAVIGLLSATSISAYLLSLTPIADFLPQSVAFLAILFIVFRHYRLPVIYLVSLIVNLIIFSTGALNSPFLFLIYFLLFIAAFIQKPAVSLSFSVVSILLLSQSLNSPLSLIPLISLIFITPLVWLVSRQSRSLTQTTETIAVEETDFLLWLNLKFKTGITAIIDLSSQLLSAPVSPVQKESLQKIRSSAKSLLNSADKLTSEIDQKPDET